jgi:RNA polymerase sigma factor (sigma-70 family)
MSVETLADDVLERARKGDGPARDALASRYYPAVYSFARKLTGRVETALDVTQETFLRAFSRIGQHDPAYSFLSWLFKIAANHVRDLHRQAGRIEPSLAGASDSPADAILERSENLDRVRRALDRLPSDIRMALVLHLQEELSVREIAFVLDQTDNAVRMKIYRGLQKVRALVREDS